MLQTPSASNVVGMIQPSNQFSSPDTGKLLLGTDEKITIDLVLEKLTSVIAATAEINGNIVSNEGYKIDGTLVGDITANTILVSKGAVVKGSIKGKKIIILGRVEGEIIANGYLVLANTAEVDANVFYKEIVTFRGHVLEGKLKRIV